MVDDRTRGSSLDTAGAEARGRRWKSVGRLVDEDQDVIGKRRGQALKAVICSE